MLKTTVLGFALTVTSIFAVVDPGSKTDLWDISQGTTVTFNTPVWSPQIAITDLFGGTGSFPQEFGQVVFADGNPEGTVHAVEWQTTQPVLLGSFALYAIGDDFASNQREFASFTLKAKSSGSPTYDLTLYTFDATHPFQFDDASQALLVSDTINPVTAQFFRAEFVQWNAGTGFEGPRVVELDGFAPLPDGGSTAAYTALASLGVILFSRRSASSTR
jgi:hypothetical protein